MRALIYYVNFKLLVFKSNWVLSFLILKLSSNWMSKLELRDNWPPIFFIFSKFKSKKLVEILLRFKEDLSSPFMLIFPLNSLSSIE